MNKLKNQVKYEGQKLFYDENGEPISMNVTISEQKDFNFHKIWMTEALQTLGLIGNKKTDVAYKLIDLMKKDNSIPYTYQEIANISGTGIDTVAKTIQVLIEANFIKRKRAGYYVLNPGIIFKGTSKNRAYYLTEYRSLQSTEIAPKKTTQDRLQDKLQELKNTQESLMEEIKETEKELELIKQKQEFQKVQKQIVNISQENQVVNK